ncbi:MAG TPA: M20 family metallopeptidase [Terriglobales bacterium]|nr:M20 family metallopeptidase [Terriglobales bacterium]
MHSTATSQVGPRELLRWAEAHKDEMVRWIARAIKIESPSFNKKALDEMADFLAESFRRAGGRVRIHKRAEQGNHLQVDFAAKSGDSKPVLLLGHHDTVWQIGSLKSMPCRVRKGRIYGPGSLDMKTGLAQILFSVRALKEVLGQLPRPVTVLSVTDEEIGSETSRALTESLAKKCAAVFVMEPAQAPNGALKTERKGVGEYTLKVTGKASHAGVDFGAGASAIVELARQIEQIAGFSRNGITANPGVIRGGTRTNVVAADAEVDVDVRIPRAADAKLLARRFRSLKPFDKRCKLEVSGGINRPPMERSRGGATLFAQAGKLAREIDGAWELADSATGGGSDGNFTAALGIPTLDGMGAVGEGAHATHECAVIAEIPRRTALLAALAATV